MNGFGKAVNTEGQAQCLELLEILRREARFALRSEPDQDRHRLPHGKAIRDQVGGLRGIHAALTDADGETPDPGKPGAITDIFAIVNAARQRFGALDRLPFSLVMQHIAAYQGRTRSRRRRKPR